MHELNKIFGKLINKEVFFVAKYNDGFLVTVKENSIPAANELISKKGLNSILLTISEISHHGLIYIYEDSKKRNKN